VGYKNIPDYALFASEADKVLGIVDLPRNDYSKVLAICEGKYWERDLDQRQHSAKDLLTNVNPSFQIVSYLTYTKRTWGVLTNGRFWRLYCLRSSQPAEMFYEVDLLKQLETGSDEDFMYFYCFFSLAALSPNPEGTALVDRILEGSTEYATGVSERLRGQVFAALLHLCRGLLQNQPRAAIDGKLLELTFHNGMVLLYRLLFVLYAEARGLLPLGSRSYREQLSLMHLGDEIAHGLDGRQTFSDKSVRIWAQLDALFSAISHGDGALGIAAYNGELFDDEFHPTLGAATVTDEYVARAIDLLSRIDESTRFGPRRLRVDYRALGVRHLGTVYEGLLEFRLSMQPGGTGSIAEDLTVVPVRDVRRGTGTYYTPEPIVQFIVQESLDPLIAGKTSEEILKLRVLDPAMGSGHFLVAAAEYLALAIITDPSRPAGHLEMGLAATRRTVIEHCLFGVDVNPLAVELAKLSLWLSSAEPSQPLTFLNHRLRCGNSVLGTRARRLATFIPRGQLPLLMTNLHAAPSDWTELLIELQTTGSASVESVHAQAETLSRMEALQSGIREALDAVVAGDLGFTDKNAIMEVLGNLSSGMAEPPPATLVKALELASEYRPFHWEIAFPEVFSGDDPGFDAVVMNPPYVSAWEMTQRDPRLRPGISRNPDLNATLRGHWDLFVAFVARSIELLRKGGMLGLILPNPVARERYATALRARLLSGRFSVALDFGEENAFAGVSRECVIYIWQNTAPSDDETIALYTGVRLLKREAEPTSVPQLVWYAAPGQVFRHDLTQAVLDWLAQIRRASVAVGSICRVSYGAQISSRERGGFGKQKFLGRDPSSMSNPKRYYEGDDMKPFGMRWDGTYLDYRPDMIYGPRQAGFFEAPKVSVRHISGDNDSLVVINDAEGFYTDHGVIHAVRYADLTSTTYARTAAEEQLSTGYDTRYIAGCLGSAVCRDYYAALFATGSLQGRFSHVYPEAVKLLPVPKLEAPIVYPEVSLDWIASNMTSDISRLLVDCGVVTASQRGGLMSLAVDGLQTHAARIQKLEQEFLDWMRYRLGVGWRWAAGQSLVSPPSDDQFVASLSRAKLGPSDLSAVRQEFKDATAAVAQSVAWRRSVALVLEQLACDLYGSQRLAIPGSIPALAHS
jgi:hypothetical protein